MDVNVKNTNNNKKIVFKMLHDDFMFIRKMR